MDLTGLARATAAPESTTTEPRTATVVRADESGLWVVAAGEDPRDPVGPCRGGWTANGTLVPPGALVALLDTPDGPWAIGVDNPALAIGDSTLAPFPNSSFENPTLDGSWSDFWTAAGRVTDPAAPLAPGQYRRTLLEGVAAHGLRCLQVEARGTTAANESFEWNVPAGSSIEVSFYAEGSGDAPTVRARIFSNVAGQYAGPFGSGAAVNTVADIVPGSDWLRYRGTVTIPPTHTKVNLFLDAGHNNGLVAGGLSVVRIDNVDADLIDLDPAAEHQDYLRRATATLAGGGIRQVTTGGNISWSQALTIAAAGIKNDEAPNGRFEISMPTNGTVIPVHHSSARTSHTVAGGVIALSADEALWYELPLGAAAASQPARFHILASALADGYVVPANWILVCRRTDWSTSSSSSQSPEYLWGDGRAQDPWRTPALNSGWSAGTIAPAYTRTHDGDVVLRGRIRSGAGSALTLPPGYCPGTTHTDFVRDGNGAAALITITTAGVVTTAGNNTDHSIETRFQAGQ